MLDSIAHPSRLHLIYEILPMGFLIEKAGGKTDDGTGKSVLDVAIKGYAQKISFLAGSAHEVDNMIGRLQDSLGDTGFVLPAGLSDTDLPAREVKSKA